MNEEITESAKAVQEVAKTTGQTIDVIDRLGQFFSRIMKEPIDATCGMITDTLKYKRWERQILLIEKAEKIIRERGLADEFCPVPPKMALPIFYYASLEDDDFLHDLWAKLLVSSLDAKMARPRSAYIEIIKQLDPLDVRILKEMYELFNSIKREKEKTWGKGKTGYHDSAPTNIKLHSFKIRENIQVKDDAYWSAVDNLRRQGLCQSYVKEDSVETQVDGDTSYVDVISLYGGYNYLCITALGIQFVKVCTYADDE